MSASEKASEHPQEPVFWVVWAEKTVPGVQVEKFERHQAAIKKFQLMEQLSHWALLTQERPDHDGEPSHEIQRQKL